MIYIAADHRGFRLKEELKKWLETELYEFRDLGAIEYDRDDDYPEIAIKLGETVVQDQGRGILICGSGAGASIAINKVVGIRAGLCTSVKQVIAARTDDNINVLCLSSDWVSAEDNQKITENFLNTFFSSEERHLRRINQIKDYETKKR
ncbi:MAG: Ribose 5-phosphate isomerase [Candidatus Shapirobacteria bacterium GW2011_GWE1_38_10]|uniref:Ribose 5-phosphate isomerase n=1 Tax=Candidatus Shapirobacteria bacterium GW2011_GWE1_38_10 TaxID=1618488 RepID=A0A0G0I5Q9_9BACT|nr:MAG: Ribose 5-phosphate isomerase [Candidatus Shapirobacteria bacterium GW2011_GWF2_37_20]KKQ49897.1 MAG: Ribose 5-phosphate isomerase [Candidatus Shapirobacteria bacterium GW2011_GWE1_38_10]KKQ64195.1 MAG: Ribose 5-phosphate isomerase [Candidatus Shapirobacteria bacterium GW2011_GWF1_38_23]HBP51560.1 ribose-5-phosphate isomerase [Candidatus Shapirobacteria bacterium]